MTARKKTHLIYLDKDGYTWMQEHGIGASHPSNAEFYCEVPSNEDTRWIEGKPKQANTQFLTLSPFYPSQRLDVSIEVNRQPKIMQYENHPSFEGCVKYMPIHLLDFRTIPKHISRAIHTIGLCHYGHSEAHKTVDVAIDDKNKAIAEGKKLLNPTPTEHIQHIGIKSNEEYDSYQNKKPKFK